eukprot:Opistho-2@57223
MRIPMLTPSISQSTSLSVPVGGMEPKHSYGSETVKFGRLDVARCPALAERYKVDCTPLSRQLPTLIVVRGGIECARIPAVVDGRVAHAIFSEVNACCVYVCVV